MREYERILYLIELIGRNSIGLIMMIILIKRYLKMQRMGKSNHEVREMIPSSYTLRFILLMINSILMILVIFLYYFTDILTNNDNNDNNISSQTTQYNFYAYSYTLIFPIGINILQLIVMRKEYRRQVQFMVEHQLYWLFDLILFTLLFIAEVSQDEQSEISLPTARLVTKILVFILSYYKNPKSIRVLEKSFLSQATRYFADLPSNTARSGMKIVSTLNTQMDTARTQIPTPQKSMNCLDKEDELKKIQITIKYQFQYNANREVLYILECQNYLKMGNKIILKKTLADFQQLQKDINYINNPLNFNDFSYISSQINPQNNNNNKNNNNNNNINQNNENNNNNNQNNNEKNNLEIQLNQPNPTQQTTDYYRIEEGGFNQIIEEIKIEENRLKQILNLQKFINYVMKEFYFEEVFLVKFLGLTRKQYYEEVSDLQCEESNIKNEEEFQEFKLEYPKIKKDFQICPIIKVSIQSLGDINEDNVQYYELTIRNKPTNSLLSQHISQSPPLRYTDFSNFYKQFQKDIFPIRLPEFPPKSLLNDKETIMLRKQKLVKFYNIVYNENIYFHNTLFSFQNCFEDLMIQKAQNINNDLFSYAVSLQGKYLNSSKQFLFKFYPKNSSNKKKFFIVKRFKDIINLHKDLELYYSNLLQYLMQQSFKQLNEKNESIDQEQNHKMSEEKNILKEIRKQIKLPPKPKSIHDCVSYLQEVLDCNLYHKSICFRSFLYGFEYLEELLNDNPNSSFCFSKNQSYNNDNNNL